MTGFEIDIQTSISYPEETTISKGMNNYIQKLFSAKKKAVLRSNILAVVDHPLHIGSNI